MLIRVIMSLDGHCCACVKSSSSSSILTFFKCIMANRFKISSLDSSRSWIRRRRSKKWTWLLVVRLHQVDNVVSNVLRMRGLIVSINALDISSKAVQAKVVPSLLSRLSIIRQKTWPAWLFSLTMEPIVTSISVPLTVDTLAQSTLTDLCSAWNLASSQTWYIGNVNSILSIPNAYRQHSSIVDAARRKKTIPWSLSISPSIRLAYFFDQKFSSPSGSISPSSDKANKDHAHCSATCIVTISAGLIVVWELVKWRRYYYKLTSSIIWKRE